MLALCYTHHLSLKAAVIGAQHDMTLTLHIYTPGLPTIHICILQASDQKLDGGKTWEQGYSKLVVVHILLATATCLIHSFPWETVN